MSHLPSVLRVLLHVFQAVPCECLCNRAGKEIACFPHSKHQSPTSIFPFLCLIRLCKLMCITPLLVLPGRPLGYARHGGSPPSYQWVSVFSDSRNLHKNPHSFDQLDFLIAIPLACSSEQGGMGAIGSMRTRRSVSNISAGVWKGRRGRSNCQQLGKR